MNVLFVSSEAVPFVKTGGLADVAGSLPRALRQAGARVSVFLPLYRSIDMAGLAYTGYAATITAGARSIEFEVFESGAGEFFIHSPELFDRAELYGTGDGDYSDNATRFSVFCRAVLTSSILMDIKPDIVHVNDWQTALIPVYMKTLYARDMADVVSLLTIHNLGYQGVFPPPAIYDTGLPESLFNVDSLEFYGRLSFLKGGILASDAINTVSKTYAAEMQTEAFGFGLDGVLSAHASRLSGIVNGIDYSQWNPESDALISDNYSARDLEGKRRCKSDLSRRAGFSRPDAPLLGVVSRLAGQKGIDLIVDACPEILELGCNIAVLGRGERDLEARLREQYEKYSDRIWLSFEYDEQAAHEIYAGSDVFLMPSRYEPCGLSQLIAMRYGTIPVVSATGGLMDTVMDFSGGAKATGFVFEMGTPEGFLECIKRTLEVFDDKPRWKTLMLNAMRSDFSWEHSASLYLELYDKTIARSAQRAG